MERSLVSDRHAFGGTFDLYCQLFDGAYAVVDYKTTSSLTREHGLQLAAYAVLYREHGMKVNRRIAVRIKKDNPGAFYARTYADHAGDVEVFLALKTYWHWAHKNRLTQAGRRGQKVLKGGFIDLTGRRFGRWRVVSYAGKSRWNCVCDCGVTKSVVSWTLRRGESTSCGCYASEQKSKRRLKDKTGRRFGRLVVVKRAPKKGKEYRWHCLCDCGTTVTVGDSNLSRNTRSCGRLKKRCGQAKRDPSIHFGIVP
jgi:hypothetical protein